MPDPLITILVRNKYRPELFKCCMDSITSQTYQQIRVIIGSDSPQAFKNAEDYAHRFPTTLVMLKPGTKGHWWNLYCNELKSLVHAHDVETFFMCLDNDDYFFSIHSLQNISSHLSAAEGLITQFLRNGFAKPSDELIKKRLVISGRIGGSCLILNARHKDLCNWDGNGPGGDYRYIKAISERVKLDFVNKVVVVAGNNGLHGK